MKKLLLLIAVLFTFNAIAEVTYSTKLVWMKTLQATFDDDGSLVLTNVWDWVSVRTCSSDGGATIDKVDAGYGFSNTTIQVNEYCYFNFEDFDDIIECLPLRE